MSLDNQPGSSLTPLRVLIVEDTGERQKVLTSLYRSHAWVLVHTGQRAVNLIKAYEFDLISLDYNLRGPLTGVDVAHAISRSRNKDTRIVIHSMNSVGARQMAGILPQAVSFHCLKWCVLINTSIA